jgi:hypothetical protein
MGDEMSFFFFFLPQLFYTLTFFAQVLSIWPTYLFPTCYITEPLLCFRFKNRNSYSRRNLPTVSVFVA